MVRGKTVGIGGDHGWWRDDGYLDISVVGMTLGGGDYGRRRDRVGGVTVGTRTSELAERQLVGGDYVRRRDRRRRSV